MSDIVKYDNESNEEEKSKWKWWWIIVIVLILIIAILTFGFFSTKKDEETEERERDEKLIRLKYLEVEINISEREKARVEKFEYWIKFAVRVLLGLGFVYLDYSYYRPDLEFDNNVGRIVDLNTAILSIYALIGFMIFGSVHSFVERFKYILSWLLRYFIKVRSLEEIEELKKERDQLKKDCGLD